MINHFRGKISTGFIGAACLFWAAFAGAAEGRPPADVAGTATKTAVAPLARAAPMGAVADVKLDGRGSLSGTVSDRQGAALAGVEVTVERFSPSGRVAATKAITDRNGRFQTTPLSGGAYLASSAGGATAMRLWQEGAAPPSATGGVLIVGEGDVARAQSSTNLLYEFLEERPAITYPALAAAVVIPIVEIADDQDERKKGS
jgi:hypothetical protein